MLEDRKEKTEWDRRYSEPGYAYGIEANEFLASVEAQLPRGRVLSLAEGEGRNGVFLAKRGFRVTAVDQSAVGLAKARILAHEQGVALTTIQADLGSHAIKPDCWEVVVSIFCHVQPTIRARLYRAAVNGLVPGGALVLEAYTPQQLGFGTGGPKDSALLVDLAVLRHELMGLRFEIERE
ncbi:MAG: class I SAM-dependent methyltransferase, partial [Gammaproteobacteria bacterium]